ncbi:MAG: Mu-like prophage major head subunit gpT family protein, partial [Ktedonobacteraceae bacterium]
MKPFQIAKLEQEQLIALEGHILEGQTLDKQGHDVRVTVIQGGQSKNGFSYDTAALQRLALMLEGVQAYADHDTSAPVRSVRDMVGFYTNAAYVAPANGSTIGRVDATLHILEAASWLWSIIYESVSIGKPDLVGLSVDIFGTWSQDVGSSAKHVTGVRQINSCDIVTRPSAGGAFQRIIHSHSEQQGDPTSMDPITLTPPTMPSGTPLTLSPATNPEPEPTPPGGSSSQRIAEQQDSQVQALLQQLQQERAQLALERRLLESVLPQAVTTPIRERYSGRIFEMADLERDLVASQQMMAALASQGIIRDNGYERPEIGSQITEAEKVQAAFDLMFEDDKMKMLSDSERTRFAGVRAFTSIREAYARATGDPSVSGSGAMNLGTIRVSEHAPVGRITEADTTTASFSYLLGTSMNKRLLKDYQAWPAEWVRFCTIVPIKDFKQQTRVRLGAFGSLSTVAEDTAYSTISLSDTAATYVPTKRGNLVTVSRETIVNDDLFAIKQIPTKLAVAAAYTLAEFVYAFLSTNPNIFDGSALFTSGAPHSNLASNALSSAAMQTGVTAMREQTNFAGKRIGLRPKYLIVPPELEFTAMVVTKSAGIPGSANNDINPMLGYVTPIVSP